MKKLALYLWKDEGGQDLTEYALLLTLIALVSVATINTLGQTINNVFTNTVNGFTST
jgi:Flp pilus assembly pilin Flp